MAPPHLQAVRFTFKKHEEYQGTKQTIIERLHVIKRRK